MQERAKTAQRAPLSAAQALRYQVIFIVVGAAIVLGGLWFLYQENAPYHPDVPVSEGELIAPAAS